MIRLIERYVLRTATLSFVAALVVLTAVIWLTQALREFDLLTLKGQSLVIFFTVTGLAIPSLVMVIAPIALFIAIVYTLNKLNGDSELVVMSAAGLSPQRLMRPFGILMLASAVLVGAMSLAVVPWGFRELRDLLAKVRADFITRIVKEGTFATLEDGFIFHYRERGPDGSLRGIFIQDRRDLKHVTTYLAERGATLTVAGENYLALEQGSLQREDATSTGAAIVVFKSYNIDLTQFAEQVGPVSAKPRERTTMELIGLDPAAPDVAPQLGRFRAELLDRFSNPLYALAFGTVALAALGEPRTTRQGRGGAVAAAVLVVLAVRVAGFSVSNLVVRYPAMTPVGYALPVATAALALAWLGRRAFARRRRQGRGAALIGAA